MIVATAGHVDHGKTELIKALTGTDTDRLPEEKTRGLSIDLGFAYQSLADDTRLGFVDVPGHEKFIRNMLAGVGGIDLGLLVVAADDGVMPQTREHAAILDLLGIDQRLVAITKIDRVDRARVQEVQRQVESLLEQGGNSRADVYPVCAPANDGVDELKDALDQRARDISTRDTGGFFRLAIDRVFTLKGVGLVVTGMVFSGCARIDDQLVVSSNGASARIRGIRANDSVSEQANAGERCAINLVGRDIDESSLRRGDWLMHPRLLAPTQRIDVELRVLESETRALKHWSPVHLHIGSDRLAARVAVLEGGSIQPGDRGLAQLVLDRDSFVVHGDRFVLRDQSAQRTIAGGQVIDPYSPKRGRARPARIAMLRAMNQVNDVKALGSLVELHQCGLLRTSFELSRNLTEALMDDLIESLGLLRVGSPAEQYLFNSDRWQDLRYRIETSLAGFHESKPQLPGASLKDIQLALRPHTPAIVLEAALNSLASEDRVRQRGARWHLPGHEMLVSEQDRQLWDAVEPCLAPSSGSPMSLHQAAEALGVEVKLLGASLKTAVKMGAMAQIAKNRFLPTGRIRDMAMAAESLAHGSADGYFTAAEYCAQIETGRNFAIDLLEYFDRLGFTERSGDHRRIRRSAESVFGNRDSGN